MGFTTTADNCCVEAAAITSVRGRWFAGGDAAPTSRGMGRAAVRGGLVAARPTTVSGQPRPPFSYQATPPTGTPPPDPAR